jgi:hypothetical protein
MRTHYHFALFSPVLSVLLVLVAALSPAEIVGKTAQSMAEGSVQGTSGAISATRIVDHLKLTLSMDGRSQPLDALVPLRMTVDNLSGHTVRLLRSGCDRNPSVRVTDAAGHLYYAPTAFTWYFPSCGGFAPPVLLAAGHRIVRSMLTLVPARIVVMSVGVVSKMGERYLDGPRIRLSLHAAALPTATLHTLGSVGATIYPPPGAHGEMRYQEMWGCKASDGGYTERASALEVWGAGPSRTLVRTWPPECGPRRWWRVVAGWIGYPVARVHYGVDLLAPKGR